jgi:hypothetical protein
MAFKKKIIVLALAAIPLIAFSQKPDYIGQTIRRKDRAVFLLDSVIAFDKQDALTYIHPEDSALVGAILQKGVPDEDYTAFFQRKGYKITKIRQADFNHLRPDTTILSETNKRLLKEYYSLSKRSIALMTEGKSSTRLDKKMRRRKYLKALEKEDCEYPILFAMYPIYRYQQFTLVMYHIVVNKYMHDFSYLVYTTPV